MIRRATGLLPRSRRPASAIEALHPQTAQRGGQESAALGDIRAEGPARDGDGSDNAAMSNLTEAWTTASAALPNGWRIVGVLHADLYVELARLPAYLALATTYPEQWIAMAEGPDGDPGEVGQGETPVQALLHLARIVEPIRGVVSG